MTGITWDPSIRTLRHFAAVGGIFLAGVAAFNLARGRGWTGIVVLVVLAVSLGVIGCVRPKVLRLPYVLVTLVVSPIGTVASLVILVVLFYGVITPLGLMARLVRPDPLGSPWGRGVQSYWNIRPRPRGPSSYLRQA
jgi:hypothetical protein